MSGIYFSPRAARARRAKGLLGVALGVLIVFCHVPLSAADSVELEDVDRVLTTDDGYDVKLMLNQMSVNSVDNMAETPFTREAFVSAQAGVEISGSGKASLDGAMVRLGIQVSCQIDLSSGMQLGGQIGVGFNLPPSMNNTSGLINPQISGQIQGSLKPGQIVTVPLAEKQLATKSVTTRVLDQHLNVDSCGGPAFVRAYAVMQVSTVNHDDSFSIFGPIAPF